MSRSSRTAVRAEKATPSTVAPRVNPVFVGILAWFLPGAGHLLMGQVRKALTFLVVLLAMFAIGLAFGGRLFPFQMSEPLVFLAALAEWTVAMPRVIAAMAGVGAGNVVAVTYEYGNTFLIVSGLLNALVLLDAVDLATGRKSR
jgi:uncharacterized protein DUF6677